MIMWMRLNAFFALICAAILVSLMSPGGDKITRVAQAFGASAGGIGIVIALAAVIGKCLMESGAADRIVRSCVKALGEERAPLALMSSGFVLSVPVFFDTVFYLLVPLARSMWKTRRRDFVLYTTAIVAGGAVTHSMVPPTPGPLAMADNLGIDLGVMMLAGTLIGIPMSVAGLACCWLLNRWRPIEMRSSPAEGIGNAGEGTENEPSVRAEDELPPFSVAILPVLLPVLLVGSNTLSGMLLSSDSDNRIRQIISVAGNPNVALMVSAAISIYLMARYTKRTLAQLAVPIEQALASGGVVILITAAGGAFGKMLAAAGIQESIQSALGDTSTVTGVSVLITAFAIASVMKFAQGSGTVAMVTASSMIAAMGFTTDQLGFHMVYLATAIGSGSLVGDWMNNSGFWIFSKMSFFTTKETLQTWSVLTAALGITGFLVTLAAAMMLPMI